MSSTDLLPASQLRAAFSAAMSRMYRSEVPAYGDLIELVEDINRDVLARNEGLRESLGATDGIERITAERHGAIRVGTAEELSMLRRVFAVMGMEPVGYYDLSVAGIPVHSTAFRPVEPEALAANPFRVFTSLLRLDLIDDEALRREAEATLAARSIFNADALELTARAEAQGGLDAADADAFIGAVLETFRWQPRAQVDEETYQRLHAVHRLVADVVSFRGPHINHLTPRTLDIDAAQTGMPARGITPKAVVEGPPRRQCPILLRQTSFKALDEPVAFRDGVGGWKDGRHTARFGEIEQRGAALTPKGRALYDELLTEARARVTPHPDGSNAHLYRETLAAVFSAFPDDWATLRRTGMAYFQYSLTAAGTEAAAAGGVDASLDALIEQGLVRFDPVIYEDFLPVSAAGIFQSNLGDGSGPELVARANRRAFEAALGAEVHDELALYAGIEERSVTACLEALRPVRRAGVNAGAG